MNTAADTPWPHNLPPLYLYATTILTNSILLCSALLYTILLFLLLYATLPQVCEKMLEWSMDATANSHSSDLLELYCGGGTFTNALASNFRQVTAASCLHDL